jgi:large subunit ribosomal protein L29
MKAHEIRQLSEIELKKRIQDEEESLANLRFQKALSQVDNPMKFRQTRREIARMRTILRERQQKNPPQPEVKAEAVGEPKA